MTRRSSVNAGNYLEAHLLPGGLKTSTRTPIQLVAVASATVTR